MSEDEDYLRWLAFISGESTAPGASNPQNLLRYVQANLGTPDQLDLNALQQAAQQVERGMAEGSDWDWLVIRAALQQMARDNSVPGVLARKTMADIELRSVAAAVREMYAVETALRSQLPTTPEQAAEVQQAAAKVTASLRERKLVGRIRAAFKHVDLAKLTPWGGLVLATWFLMRLGSEPGSTPSNDLVVISIVFPVAAIILHKD